MVRRNIPLVAKKEKYLFPRHAGPVGLRGKQLIQFFGELPPDNTRLNLRPSNGLMCCYDNENQQRTEERNGIP